MSCGAKLESTELNLDIIKKYTKNIKGLNVASAILNFIYAAFYGGTGIYILSLVLGIFSYENSGGSGLILLTLPFLLILAIGFFVLGIFNLRINKIWNTPSIETISIIEICAGVLLQVFAVPTLIISIIRMVLLSKIKKSCSD